jgi:quinol monooxygenase YgiN
MIAWGLRIHVPPGKRDEVHRILRSLLEPVRVRGGCLACRVYQDIEDPDVLALIQEWTSWDDLTRYLRSEDSRKFLAVMDLAIQQPEIWFDTISSREGLERLAAARGAGVERR